MVTGKRPRDRSRAIGQPNGPVVLARLITAPPGPFIPPEPGTRPGPGAAGLAPVRGIRP